jgi:hypothetical protein
MENHPGQNWKWNSLAQLFIARKVLWHLSEEKLLYLFSHPRRQDDKLDNQNYK